MAAKRTQRKKSSSKAATGVKRAGSAKVISSRLSFKGRVFNVFTDTLEEPDGHRHIKDVVRHHGSVVILAVDERINPADPDVILERQYRHAAGQFLIELPAGTRNPGEAPLAAAKREMIEETGYRSPAGTRNPGEAPLAAAKREMIEETGYRAKRWTMLQKYFASPGFLGEWMQIYLARDIRQGEAHLELDENLEVLRVPLSQAMRMVAAGKIHDGKTIIGLSLYDAARKAGRL